jgi:hypothetical protein
VVQAEIMRHRSQPGEVAGRILARRPTFRGSAAFSFKDEAGSGEPGLFATTLSGLGQ